MSSGKRESQILGNKMGGGVQNLEKEVSLPSTPTTVLTQNSYEIKVINDLLDLKIDMQTVV